ncbi:T9SS type A sorting domain-containing protein [Hyphobacterium sp. CCMP332]|nr:T9SS type A sorting domain-containing protein [Hyphobacterium sp. CCMP332]
MSHPKKFSLLFVLCFFLFNGAVKAQSLKWAKSMGGSFNDDGLSIFVDGAGNVYTTGFYWGSADFDPGPGLFILTSVGGQDIFVQKLDSSGNFLWAKSFGGTSTDEGLSIAVDASGNVYTTGFFRGTADFDPGPGIFNLSSAGDDDIFILKLDASGNFLWAKSIGDFRFDAGNSITVDAAGNVYTTGSFERTVDFDPGPGITNLTSNGNPSDIFVLKLDASGNFLWAKAFGGTDYDDGRSIKVDASGNVISIGEYEGTVDFDPGPGTFNLTSVGDKDIFILNLDSSGNFNWAKSIGGASEERRSSISLDIAGNIYATGIFTGVADFNPGAGIFNLTPSGNEDAFVLKLNASGNFQWARSVGGPQFDEGNSIDVDASGNVYTAGFAAGTVDLDPGPGILNVSGGYVQILGNSGNFIWAAGMGSNCYSVKAGTSGNFYTTGNFTGTRDFNPGPGTSNLTSAGGRDIYVLKLGPCVQTSSVETISSCNSYTWQANGQTYSGSGSYNYTLTNAAGCDSVLTLNLTINNSTFATISESACSSYLSPAGNTYSTSGTYIDTIPNTAGCDSIITINLSIQNSSSTIFPVVCDSYLSPSGLTYSSSGVYSDTILNSVGCDSVITINLTINSSSGDSINPTACTSYLSPAGNTYTASGLYYDTLFNSFGCDSIITINLSIVQPTTSSISPSACQSYLSPGGNTYSSSGTYTDTVLNSSGCDSIITINLTINSLPSFMTINVIDLECYGDNDGEALLIPTAGPAPYSYYWSGPTVENGPFQQNLHAGTYYVQMTDANGCIYTDSVVINSPPEIVRSFNIFSPTCGNYNGAIDLTASGGLGSLSYQWNTGATTEDINSINANFYTVSITDSIGCVAIEGIPVSSQGGPSLSINNIISVSCYGLSDGAIDVDISGIYQVSIWANGGTSEDLSNIQAGPYHLIVADTLSGCVSVLNAFVPQPDPIYLDVITTTSICNDSTGTATLNMLGGNGGGTITWSNGSSGNTVNALAAGVYSVNYSDSKGCSDMSNFAISDAGAPLIFLDSIINVPCGGSTGEIQLTTTGNVAQNVYSWSNGLGTEDLTGAGPGTYILNVTDPVGCQSFFVDDIERIPAGVPKYCHTMFDSISQNNIVLWDVPVNLSRLDHYSIWKESSQAGFYQKMGETNNLSAGIYYDTLTNPDASYARYKVSVVDSCGLETVLSAHKKTVHLTQNFGVIPNTINLNWDNYEGYPLNTWFIYRNSQAQGWEIIDSVPSNSFSYTDQPPFQLSDPELYYVIKAGLPLTCNQNYHMVRSNNSNSSNVMINLDHTPTDQILQIYPNPTRDEIYLKSNHKGPYNLEIYNLQGNLILSKQDLHEMENLSISNLPSGSYFIKIESEKNKWIKKLIKH